MHAPIFCQALFIHQYPLTLTMPLEKSAEFATDANMSGIAESRVPAGQLTPDPAVHFVITCCINFLPPSRRIAESDIPALRREDGTTAHDWEVQCTECAIII